MSVVAVVVLVGVAAILPPVFARPDRAGSEDRRRRRVGRGSASRGVKPPRKGADRRPTRRPPGVGVTIGSNPHAEWRDDAGVYAAAVRFDLHIPQSRSLKEKRAAIRPIVDGLRHRFHVSVAEVDHQDQWQRARRSQWPWSSGSASQLREMIASIERFVDNAAGVELLDVETAWLERERA